MLNNVLLFTASDFGRTLASNGDSCDHGWGSHHLVAGGAVKGREIYGNMPINALGTNDDLGATQRLQASLGEPASESSPNVTTVVPNQGPTSGPSPLQARLQPADIAIGDRAQSHKIELPTQATA